MKKKKRRKSNKPKRSKEELERIRRDRRFKTNIRTTFINCGFKFIGTREIDITFGGYTTDFDAIFTRENLIVVVEDTTLQDPDNHLRKKADAWKAMAADTEGFIEELADRYPDLKSAIDSQPQFEIHDYRIRFVYVSYFGLDKNLSAKFADDIRFMDDACLQYFLSLSKTIRRSSLYELLSFLRVELDKFGVSNAGSDSRSYQGLYLPETPSGFAKGHKIVSLLMDPQTLLERCFVLRADGWRDADALYQRLLVKHKIGEMRQYLDSEKRVFVNNVIVTFPDEVTIRGRDGKEIRPDDPTKRTDIIPVNIALPTRLASIGIVDGQHRIFSYHEGADKYEQFIAPLRRKQHLLVTGIIYPPSTAPSVKQQFEAKLFLEINDKQKRVRGDLKQAIATIVSPRTAIAIAKAVITRVATQAPMLGIIERHAFDKGKLKTTSIVSYGLKFVVDPRKTDSLFARWQSPEKDKFDTSPTALEAYIEYCTSALRQYFSAFKAHLPSALWTLDRETSRALNATSINGLIYALRVIVARGRPLTFEQYRNRFQNLTVSFQKGKFRYKSSHWKSLGDAIVRDCFADL